MARRHESCDDGTVQLHVATSTSVSRRLFVSLALFVVFIGGSLALASCASGPSPISRASTTIAGDSAPVSTQAPSFLPDDPNRNLSECIGTVERPGCGSKARGGWRMGLTFGVLMLGIALIGATIVRSARRRARRVDPVPEGVRWAKPAPATPTDGLDGDA